MKLSIITINYNNLQGFKKTYDSVVNQTFTDYEWIVIDGGSTDGGREFIEQHKQSFAYWCSEPDGGIYQALNKGAKIAKGEYISFMNAGDCYADRNTLSDVFSNVHSAEILFGDVVLVSKEGCKTINYPDNLTYNWLRQYTINHQSTFTRREVFEILSFDVKYRFLADRKFWLQSMIRGYRFEHLPLIVSHYDYSGFSTQNEDKWEAEKKAIYEEVTPEGLKENLTDGHIYESHQDLRLAYSILQHHGLRRKLLHLCIKLLCSVRAK